MRVRSFFKRIFHFLVQRLGIRRFREHSFFGTLLARPAVVADFGAHRGEFFAALKAEYPVSRALLVEADPALAESLKQTFANEPDVIHAALVGENHGETITFTRSTEPEASSIFSERVGVYGVLNQVKVPPVVLAEVVRHLGGSVDLAKFDIEGAEIQVLQTARSTDLAACSQLTVEFHDNMQPITGDDVDRVCRRMRSEGYCVVNANWPYSNDILFVNLRSMSAARRMGFCCRVALANSLFIARRIMGMFIL